MKYQRLALTLLVPLSAVFLSGCEVIGDIFKTGMGVGIFLVVIVIAVIIFIFTRIGKKK